MVFHLHVQCKTPPQHLHAINLLLRAVHGLHLETSKWSSNSVAFLPNLIETKFLWLFFFLHPFLFSFHSYSSVYHLDHFSFSIFCFSTVVLVGHHAWITFFSGERIWAFFRFAEPIGWQRLFRWHHHLPLRTCPNSNPWVLNTSCTSLSHSLSGILKYLKETKRQIEFVSFRVFL